MPYITEEKREILDPTIDALYHLLVGMQADDELNNMEGNMNYIISRLMMMIYGDRNSTRYAQINDAVGVLECVKMEYYRKVAAPYENQKEHDNGPVDATLTPVVTSEVVVEKEDEEKE